MRTRTLSRDALIPLAVMAGLALLIILTSPFASKPASAQIVPQALGDNTTIFGGATSGSNTAVSVATSASANYVISATVPGGGNFYGAVLEITYDPTKATPNCAEENVNGAIRVYCNDGYPGNKVRIVIESSTVSGQSIVGMTGTNSLVTISWTGVAATADAISSMVIVGSCINGAGETLTPCNISRGALTVTGGGGFPWGDANCSGAVTSTDISIIVFVAAGGTRPGGCAQPIDLNCSGAVTSTDISMVVFIAAGGTINPCSLPNVSINNIDSNAVVRNDQVMAQYGLNFRRHHDAS